MIFELWPETFIMFLLGKVLHTIAKINEFAAAHHVTSNIAGFSQKISVKWLNLSLMFSENHV